MSCCYNLLLISRVVKQPLSSAAKEHEFLTKLFENVI